jgi:hypothetical protein
VAFKRDKTQATGWQLLVGMMDLGQLPGGSTRNQAFAVSGDGSIVVGDGFANGNEAFI